MCQKDLLSSETVFSDSHQQIFMGSTSRRTGESFPNIVHHPERLHQCQTQAAKQPRRHAATKASIGHCHTRSLCVHPSAAQECSHEHLPAYHFTCLTQWAQCKAGIHIVYTCTQVHKLFMFGLRNLPISVFALCVHRCIGGFRNCCCVCPITAPLHTWTVLGQSMMLLFCNGVQTLKIP